VLKTFENKIRFRFFYPRLIFLVNFLSYIILSLNIFILKLINKKYNFLFFFRFLDFFYPRLIFLVNFLSYIILSLNILNSFEKIKIRFIFSFKYNYYINFKKYI